MALCDIEGYDGIQGASLVPILQQSADSVRDHVLIEDDIADIVERLTPIPCRTRTLITDSLRYTRNSKGEEQLFDLQEDADEMHDLKTQESARRGMVDRLASALLRTSDAARGAPATAQI